MKITSARIVHANVKKGEYRSTVMGTIEGKEVELFRYYPDELFFDPIWSIGKTEEEAVEIFFKKDKEYLQS